MPAITIEGDRVRTVSPEGVPADVPLAQFLGALFPLRMHTGDLVLPDGVKAVCSRGRVVVLVHQTPPTTFSVKWIAGNSPVPFGPGTEYRTVRLALPYVVVLAVFVPAPGGGMQLSQRNECFFRNEPLNDLAQDELLYPALLNCSKFTPEDGHPLSWICTQHLDHKPYLKLPSTNGRVRAAFKHLMRCLFDSGFNLSSENHEGQSWFSESVARKIDERVETVERWEQESATDPLFVLKVPWLKTGRTVAQVVERIFKLANARNPASTTADDMARLIFNHK